MKVAVHQPQYLPWLGYFDKIMTCDTFVFLDCVRYKHREFQNRNRIRTPKGWMWLTVPIINRRQHEQIISETKINNTFAWQRKHLHALKAYYEKCPYFDKYFSFFQDIYSRKWDKLIELNVYIINYLNSQFKIKTKIIFESDIGTSTTGTERIIEICKKINATSYVSGIGGKNYLRSNRFQEENISLEYKDFKHPIYKQLYSSNDNDFQMHMSAIDLLFNYGEKSRDFLTSKL